MCFFFQKNQKLLSLKIYNVSFCKSQFCLSIYKKKIKKINKLKYLSLALVKSDQHVSSGSPGSLHYGVQS